MASVSWNHANKIKIIRISSYLNFLKIGYRDKQYKNKDKNNWLLRQKVHIYNKCIFLALAISKTTKNLIPNRVFCSIILLYYLNQIYENILFNEFILFTWQSNMICIKFFNSNEICISQKKYTLNFIWNWNKY